MASIDLIRASNGSGDAVKATVTNARVISSTTLQIDATTNWPNKFIATVGDVDGTGAFVPATVTVFNGILSGGNIEITSFAPGYTDIGNTPGQVVVLKPTTAWANEVADTLAVAHNDNGTLKADSVDTAAIQDQAVTTPKLVNNAAYVVEKDMDANNGYIRYSDGTQIAWKRQSNGAAWTLWQSGIYYRDFSMGNWAKPFTSISSYWGASDNMQVTVNTGGCTTTSAGDVRHIRPSNSGQTAVTIVTAIGTWGS